jgi:hypothetical protein
MVAPSTLSEALEAYNVPPLVRTAFEGAHHVHWDQRGLLDADVVELMAKLLAPAPDTTLTDKQVLQELMHATDKGVYDIAQALTSGHNPKAGRTRFPSIWSSPPGAALEWPDYSRARTVAVPPGCKGPSSVSFPSVSSL